MNFFVVLEKLIYAFHSTHAAYYQFRAVDQVEKFSRKIPLAELLVFNLARSSNSCLKVLFDIIPCFESTNRDFSGHKFNQTESNKLFTIFGLSVNVNKALSPSPIFGSFHETQAACATRRECN